ncbi:HpcH/HpaI aldolase/citrate lyase family protein [Clostridium felsineum]|uniref:HpcH/HpaI aldolase/citrate lyase family protein n=1 Tax=Clostridium felsineum TaxID=36839 RepID=UPI00098C3925|nr:aldolase/citrate lyase family protein [Clostridium felsineum]URZ18458.1 Citrate lyase subunit beta [Clostridium felsineum DSM 794]
MIRKTLWGAHMFVPGNNAGFLCKLPIIDVKNIIIDLEFATKIPFKTDGRYLTRNAISYIRMIRPDINICVRVNLSAAKNLQDEDIKIIAKSRPDSIRIPSVSSKYEVEYVDELLTKLEKENDIEAGSIKLQPMIENPQGLKHASEIIQASPRVQAIALGGEDWAYNCGLHRTIGGHELDLVKFEMVTIAAEHKIMAIDTVFSFLKDTEGLIADCNHSKVLGFKARSTINPRQINIINKIYAPLKDEIEWAKTTLEDLEEVKFGDNINYVSKGVIVDPLSVYQAKNIINSNLGEVCLNEFN